MKTAAASLLLVISSVVQTGVNVHAQGVPCTGLGCFLPPQPCKFGLCFKNPQDEAEYERANNCKFGEQCGTQFIKDKQTKCCGKDPKTGAAVPVDKVPSVLNPDFNWADYQKQCPNMRQSEAAPDNTWKECKVGERETSNDYPIIHVEPYPINSATTREYCIDGCSTPQAALNIGVSLNIFVTNDKDNPTGHPNSSFLEACTFHDVCYQTCTERSQSACDDAMLRRMQESCRAVPENSTSSITVTSNVGGIPISAVVHINTRRACFDAASAYRTGLGLPYSAANNMLGLLENAFLKRKQQYCQCC
jgi:hypothetical protein